MGIRRRTAGGEWIPTKVHERHGPRARENAKDVLPCKLFGVLFSLTPEHALELFRKIIAETGVELSSLTPEAGVNLALAFYQAHRAEIDAGIQADSQLELARG